ncbi:hypothetical protein KQX54_009054 [Cotesia glomerata]|uniref:Uncharacterized protein n=1 Tax=Cotesia glomerata TaxID=32391 RepID=A0AAV7J3V9_COTGL|nr:hypothetical protein KQX54_009054 [Cotesia glomerata]
MLISDTRGNHRSHCPDKDGMDVCVTHDSGDANEDPREFISTALSVVHIRVLYVIVFQLTVKQDFCSGIGERNIPEHPWTAFTEAIMWSRHPSDSPKYPADARSSR